MTWKKLLGLVLAIIILGGTAMFGAMAGGIVVFQLMSNNKPAVAATTAQPTAQAVTASSQTQSLVVNTVDVQTAITKAVQEVGPSVVTVVGTIPGQQSLFGFSGTSTSTGSGVFISSDGYVLTNNHVIDGAQQLQVIFSDGTTHDGTLVGTDQYSDLAVLKVTGKVPAVATLGNSDALNPGETVIAIGSPLGDFKNTVTVGVVSATGRSIDTGNGYTIDGLIQTDAAINQGNSGGPLVNLAGEVIALNTLIIRSSGSGTVTEGLGFAIPINTARVVSNQIIQTGHVSRPYLGISWQPITPSISAMHNLPVQYGAFITNIYTNSPADKAGLQAGDIITGIDNTQIDATHAYLNTLFQYAAGDTVTLTINRNGRTIQLKATLGASGS